MKTIDILADIRHEGAQYFKGERRVVTPELAGYFCGNSWAKDVTGEIATGEPDISPKTLEVQNGQISPTSTNAGEG